MMSKHYTKKELETIHKRAMLHLQLSWNFERMQGLGYLSAMLPVLEESYKDNPELLEKALRTHAQYFNSEPTMTDIIIGVNVSLEEETENEDIIAGSANIKSSMMQPFATIGDTIFGIIIPTILGAIAIEFSLNGNYFGVIMLFIYSIIRVLFIRPYLFRMGYEHGKTLLTNFKQQMNAFIDAAIVLGLIVIGAMIATMVDIQFGGIRDGVMATEKIVNDFGELVEVPKYLEHFNFQVDFFDKVMPKFGAILLMVLAYWLLGKKRVSANKLIIGTVLVCLFIAFIAKYTILEILV